MNEFVYQPTASWIKDSHFAHLAKKAGKSSPEDLLKWSQENLEAFWNMALNDIGLRWRKPFDKLLSSSLPWPQWATNGEISIVENCIDRHAEISPQSLALIFEADEENQTEKWTYADLQHHSSFVAHELVKAGAKPGDRAALLMPMSPEMVASFFGILRAGLTVTPIFSGYGADAIAARLQDAEVKFVFIQEKTTRRGKEVPVATTLKEALPTCPSVRKTFVWNRNDFKSGGHKEVTAFPSVTMSAEQECLLLYTSGTTGKPKACVHTPFGVLATTGKELRYGFDVKKNDRFFWYTDIGWMMGPWELLGVLQFGATVVLYEGVPDFPTANRLWDILEKHNVTHLGISPTAVRVLKKTATDGPDKYAFSDLRILGSTGEPWDEETWRWYFERVGKGRCPIMNISGGTEIMGCLLMPHPFQALKPSTLGGPALGVCAESWNEDAQKISRGIGHLVCKSPLPSMTKGFLNTPERYLETYFHKFGDQIWYHGDWAFIDDDGLWYLRGRSDDTIKIAGKRVGPNEFESALMEDSRVAEVAAIGLPHEIKGEMVHCFVVLKNSADASLATQTELKKLAEKTMGKALQPDKIIFVDALPKTRSGKILRGIIRKIVLKENFDDSSVDQLQAIEAIKTPRFA